MALPVIMALSAIIGLERHHGVVIHHCPGRHHGVASHHCLDRHHGLERNHGIAELYAKICPV